MKPIRNRRPALLAALAVAAVAITIEQSRPTGTSVYADESGAVASVANPIADLPPADIETLERVSQAFAAVSDAVKPSVVFIETSSNRVEMDKDMEDLFRSHGFEPRPAQGTGSGIIFTADGLVVTNNHVVAEADAIRVMLADGRRYNAEIIGTDPKTDLAVLQIQATNLTAAKFGDSDGVRVGHLVLAIGSPFRLGHSVTHGIISAIGRSDVNVDIDYQDWFQTDAPINPGNSGGPLINTRGEVIGINTAIATESGANQGVAFAIPANTIKHIVSRLKSGQPIVRGYLGVQIEQVDPQIASAYGLKKAEGVLVRGVGRGTPADSAGLRPEDIILAVDDRRVGSRERLQHLIARIEPGTTTDLTVWRKGHELTLNTKIQAQPNNFSTTGRLRDLRPGNPTGTQPPTGRMRDLGDEMQPGTLSDAGPARVFRDIGFEASTVTPALAKKYELPENVINGVIVTRVYPTGDAYESGLRPGYVITMANDKHIANIAEIEAALTPEMLRKGVRLKYLWGGMEQFAVLSSR